MTTTAKILIALVALIQTYIFWLEAFGWITRGPKVFKSLSPDFFERSRPLAANQGLYNLFLAAGLAWPLAIADPSWASSIAVFFLACVALAGVVGGMTVQKSILLVQTVPAAAGLVALWLRI